MERQEVKAFIEKVMSYYPTLNFEDREYMRDEWEKELSPYHIEDVERKFKEHLNGEYSNVPPKLHYLTRYLRTDEEQEEFLARHKYCRCTICGKIVEYMKFDEHHDRCLDVWYLHDMCKKHFGKELSKNQLFNIPKEKFDEYYWQSCEKIYLKMEDCLDKRVLRNAILTHSGKEPQYTVEELLNRVKE